MRGNQRVTNDNPEDTYNVLQKYGQDLVDLARKQKLDPVIGRDQEIRNVKMCIRDSTYGENYCTMVALMDAVTDALTESAVVS